MCPMAGAIASAIASAMADAMASPARALRDRRAAVPALVPLCCEFLGVSALWLRGEFLGSAHSVPHVPQRVLCTKLLATPCHSLPLPAAPALVLTRSTHL